MDEELAVFDAMVDAYQNDSTSHCNSSYSDHQKTVILIAMGGTAAISAAVCTVSISFVLCLCLIKQFAYRLAVYQVMGTLFYSLSMTSVLLILNYSSDSLYFVVTCKMEAFFIHYSLWVKSLFTLWLSFHLFSYVVFLKNFKKLEPLYVLTSIFVPLLFIWIPFIDDVYGHNSVWCSFRTFKGKCATEKNIIGVVEILTLFYGPIVILLILNSVALIIMFFVLLKRWYDHKCLERRHLTGQKDTKLQALKQLLPLLAYPVIYLFLLLPPVLDRIYGAIAARPSFDITMSHAITGSLMGVFAGLALMIHVCSVRCPRKQVQEVVHPPPNDRGSSYVIINPKTGTSTNYEVPPESLVDREYSEELKKEKNLIESN